MHDCDTHQAVPSWIAHLPKGKAVTKAPANDNSPPSIIPWIDPRDWGDGPAPERQWIVSDLIPSRTVTLLSGDGGVGKSLLALQLGMAVAMGRPWLDKTPTPGRCVYLGAEDEEDEFERRMKRIAERYGSQITDVDNFRLVPMADRDAVLGAPDKTGRIVATPAFAAFSEMARDFGPSLAVFDTSADLFGGNENDRSQVRQFVGLLRGLAIELDAAVLLLSHPSLTGITTGSGLSGSTGWNNSVRSRLYMDRVKEDGQETGAVRLRTMKANYGPRDGETLLRWEDGVLVPDDGEPSHAQELAKGLLDRQADEVFLSLLAKLSHQGQKLSPNMSNTYAPKVIAEHPDAKGISKKQLIASMQRLIDSELVAIVEEGPPSRRRSRVLPASQVGSG